jgi:uncharacterized repeat protein (TIGR03803 family)
MKHSINLVAIVALFIPSYFALTPRAIGATRVEFVLHSFGGSPEDGKYPMAGLVFDKVGAAYGTTTQGGFYGAGVVFKLTPVGSLWRETVLYDFHGTTDGASPYGGVVLDRSGNLYGETIGGGTGTCFYQNVSGCGVVYELTPPSQRGGSWKESVVHTFTGGNDGATPSGNLTFDTSGALFGTTLFGGNLQEGTVFKLVRSGRAWTEIVLHSFGNVDDGAEPAAGVVFDAHGNLWGTTVSGGQYLYWGTVFEMVLSDGDWTESVLYSFDNGTDGGQPAAGLIFDRKGALYSTTLSGGVTGNGTVFGLTPPSTSGGAWVENVLYSFQDGRDGGLPQAGLIFDAVGNLYGTTHSGGESGAGAVFKLTAPAQGTGEWNETVLYSFTNGRDGGLPDSNLVHGSDGYLYGTSYAGGHSYDGTVFKITP